MDSIVGVLGLIITTASFVFAWFQYKDKQKLEQFSKSTLRGLAGNIAKIQQSTSWSVANLRDARNTAVLLQDSEIKPSLLKFVSDGLGDATATDRLITNLFNDLLTMQEAQFSTRQVTHPERNDLELYKKEQAQLI